MKPDTTNEFYRSAITNAVGLYNLTGTPREHETRTIHPEEDFIKLLPHQQKFLDELGRMVIVAKSHYDHGTDATIIRAMWDAAKLDDGNPYTSANVAEAAETPEAFAKLVNKIHEVSAAINRNRRGPATGLYWNGERIDASDVRVNVRSK